MSGQKIIDGLQEAVAYVQAMPDDEIMGTRAQAEAKLVSAADHWNEMRAPLMGTAKEHKQRELHEREARLRLAMTATVLAWHIRRDALASIAAVDADLI